MVGLWRLIEAVQGLPAWSRIAAEVLPASSRIAAREPVEELEQGLRSVVEPVGRSEAGVVFPACETAKRWVPWVLAAVLTEQVVWQAVAVRQVPPERAVQE